MARSPLPPVDAAEWVAISRELERESDRSVGIMGAALVQDCLRQAILSRLFKTDEKVAEMFDSGGPLDSFGAQIKLAYGIGLLGKTAMEDLGYIREIRNKFAHWNLLPDSRHVRRLLSFCDAANCCLDAEYPVSR